MKRVCFALKIQLFLICIIALISSKGFATTYYISNSGNDNNNGQTTSSAWKTISKVNGHSFSPGDNILFNRGDEWREQLRIPSSGSSSSQITFGVYGTGALPIISGSNSISSFTQYSGNQWRASVGSDPRMIFFISGSNVYWGRRQTSLSSVTSEYRFYYSGGYIYVYAPSDPDSRYTSVEGGWRDNCINTNDRDYITIENLELAYTGDISTGGSGDGGIRVTSGSNNITIQDNHIHHHGRFGWDSDTEVGNCIFFWGGNNHLVRRNILHDAGRHCIQLYGNSGSMSNIIIEYNQIYNSAHCNMDVHGNGPFNNIWIRYNRIYQIAPETSHNIYIAQGSQAIYVIGNLIYNSSDDAVNISMSPAGPIRFYNNTFYNNSDYHIVSFDSTSGNGYIRNNIFYGTNKAIKIKNSSGWTSDYNCFYGNSYFAEVNSTSYSNFSSYQSATGWEAHSITANPNFTDANNLNFTLQSNSPCIDIGSDLGSAYINVLDPISIWPNNVIMANQDNNGRGWEIGAYIFGSNTSNIDITPPQPPTGVYISNLN